MRIFSVVAVLLVMAISTMLQLVITLAQAELPLYLPYISHMSPLYLILAQAELARTLNEGVGNANDSSAKQLADAIAESASLAAAVITFISNWVLKRVCTLLTKREKNVTKTAYEIGNPNPF